MHTSQILPLDASGKIVGRDRADEQAAVVLDKLDAVLRQVGTGVEQLVKIDVFAARLDAIDAFQAVLAKRLAGKSGPAVSYVVGAG